ncbi:MAG: hypothetical protein JW839_02030 [Candidatus Lokiarchaeota archaeon]|nr:hypothetical protein [Candidatus Lokiarchaeota archaeon]
MEDQNGAVHRLTRHLLWTSKETLEQSLLPLPVGLNREFITKHKYILGIFAPSKEFLKVTAYFLDSSEVAKVTFVFDKIDDDIVKRVSLVIKEVPKSPIHVSGFCMMRDKYVYELYLKGTKADAAKIVAVVQKHASSFQTRIEEIRLKELSGAREARVAGRAKPPSRARQAKP